MKNKKRKKPLAHNNVSIEQRIELSLQLARVIRGGPSLVNYFILQLEAEEREGARYTRVSRIRCNGDRKRVAITVSKVSRVVHARLSLLLEEDDARGFHARFAGKIYDSRKPRVFTQAAAFRSKFR